MISFIFDAPARIFVKGIVGMVAIVLVNDVVNVTFNFWKEGFIPIFWFPLRISEQVIPSIQWMTVNIISTYRLLDLIGLDMIFDFPLDPLHLVYLGVVKRNLMTKW